MITTPAAGRWRLASPPTAVALFGVVVALFVAGFPLSQLAHLGVSSGGSELALGPIFTVVGFVVAWRKPANPLGWLLLGAVAFLALTGDASAYAVADYRWHHGALPLGWVAMLLQPAWAPAIALFGLSVLLFPDGRPPGRRWRWWLWAYLALAAAWIAGTIVITAGAIIAHNIHVDSGGDLQALNHPAGPSAWWGAVQTVFFPVLGVCWLISLGGQAMSYRRSSGERRLQLKWLLGGSAIAAAGGLVAVPLGNSPDRVLKILGGVGLLAVLALPVSMGVAILKYRLYDIDRIISAGPSPTRSSPGCWWGCMRGWCCWPRRCWGSARRGRWPGPRWPRRRCSPRCAAGCSGRWTGGSTGPATTRTGSRRPSRPG